MVCNTKTGIRIKIHDDGFVEFICEAVNTRVKSMGPRAFLVVQWLRFCLLMKGTRVWSLAQEDPTCLGAAKPIGHNYGSGTPKAHAQQWEKPPQWEAWALQLESSPHSPQLEKAHRQQWRPSTAKKKKKKRHWLRSHAVGVWNQIPPSAGTATWADFLASLHYLQKSDNDTIQYTNLVFRWKST